MNDAPPTAESGPRSPAESGGRGLVVVLNRDLFFGLRIVNTLRALGYAVALVPTTPAFVERLRTSDPPAVLGIVDLGAGPDWELLRPLLAAPGTPGTPGALWAAVEHPADAPPILAFGPHKDVAAMRAAKTAGVTRLVSNGEFHRDLVGLVGRYARPRSEPG